MFYLNLLDNLPRHHISTPLMALFIFVMKECGAQDVPSLYKLRECQKKIQRQHTIPSVKWTSKLGNIIYINDIATIIANVGACLRHLDLILMRDLGLYKPIDMQSS